MNPYWLKNLLINNMCTIALQILKCKKTKKNIHQSVGSILNTVGQQISPSTVQSVLPSKEKTKGEVFQHVLIHEIQMMDKER